MKRIFVQGGIAGVLAAIAGVIYFSIYQNTLDTDLGKIVNVQGIIGSSIFGAMLIASGYAVLFKVGKLNLTGWYNVLVAVVSFATIIAPISASLPLTIESPELFPGLVVPMHFFPALAFFTIAPFFRERVR